MVEINLVGACGICLHGYGSSNTDEMLANSTIEISAVQRCAPDLSTFTFLNHVPEQLSGTY